MILSINKDAKVADLQQAFHHYFPYLKIEVFDKAHEPHVLSADRQHVTASTRLADIPTFKQEGEYEFQTNISTILFEQNMWENFGIAVQVLRKASGTMWLQTAQTDDWSLEKQNKMGYEASHPLASETTDYTLRDIE